MIGMRKSVQEILLPILIGAMVFISIGGIKLLDPTYIEWLMAGDPAGGYFAWEYYRQMPLVQWPIGDNSRYGMVMGSSIVFTDTIPIFALLFRPFSLFLPQAFQYHGFWILCCFIFQAVFAWRLLSLFANNKGLLAIGCLFFLIAPPFLWRLFGHYSLLAHWVIVCAWYFYFSSSYSNKRWLLLIGISVLIHAYFVIMVGAVWGADLLQRLLKKEVGLIAVCKQIGVIVISTLMIMWASGYFMIGTGTNIGGYGDYFRLNLLALIDPGTPLPELARRFLDPGPVSTATNHWSKLLPDLPGAEGDYEGFSFLGLGVLGLALVGLFLMAKSRIFSLSRLQAKNLLPLMICSFGIVIYAVSNQIMIGEYELLSYSLPKLPQHIVDTFRAPGRMFLVVYYLIYIGIFYVISRYSKRGVITVVCILLLCVQYFDSFDRLNSFRSKFAEPVLWKDPLTSPIWKSFGSRYKNVVFVLPKNHPSGWIPIAKFAVDNELTINSGRVAHYDSEQLERDSISLKNNIINNQLETDSLYIFLDSNLWQVAINNSRSVDFVKELDGYKVIAPNYFRQSS